MPDFDYESYEKSLEKVLESTQKDYWAQYIDINRHQVIVGRTYLWVSVALIGIYSAGYQNFQDAIHNALPFALFLLATSFLLAVIAFGICLYAMPARKGYKTIHSQGWGEFSHSAYQLLKIKKPNLYATFLTNFIYKFDIGHRYNFETNQKRAKLLRFTSWLLIGSFSLALITAITIVTTYDKAKSKEEIIMPKSDSDSPNSDSGVTTNQKSTAEFPDVPVPPPPAGTQGGKIHTHAEKPSQGKIFTTEISGDSSESES